MRAVTFRFTAAGQQAWSPQQNSRIKACFAKQLATCTVAQDATLGTGDVTAPTVTDVRYDVLLIAVASQQTGLDLPVSANQVYFLTANAAGSVILYLDP